jgi:hypothetical protein
MIWDMATTKDWIHTAGRAGVAPGDTVACTIRWNDAAHAWDGEIAKVGAAQKFYKTDVDVDVVLEGYNCVAQDCLPGDIPFTQIAVTDRQGRSVPPTFTNFINRNSKDTWWPEDRFPDLDVVIRNNNDITIVTGNG